MSSRISIVGSANIDYIMQAPRLPEVGETVTDCRFLQTFGGKGANQAVAAARAGGTVHLIGAAGDDPVTDRMCDGFRADGIDLEGFARLADEPSGSALVIFDEEGRNYLTVAPGANYRVSPGQVRAQAEVLRSSDWVVLQMEIPLESVEAVLEITRERDVPVLLNYAPARTLDLKLDRAVHGLVVNESEAAALAGERVDPADLRKAAQTAEMLRKRGGHRFVALTLGAQGVIVDSGEFSGHVPAFDVKAVDTTAAGDTFCGALAVALSEGRDLREAASFASAASALAVMEMGAQPSIPQRAAIDALLRGHQDSRG